MPHFQYIEYLLVLIAVPLMILSYTYLIRWKKKTSEKIGDAELVQYITGEYSPAKFRLKYILIVLAFILCGFAVAGLVLPDKTQRITRNGTDLVIALDVSKSMLATDIKPNRLERAKQLITRIIDQMPEERVGLVVFAGRAYLQMPITIDHSAAKMFISATSTNDVPTQGTIISNALRMSLATFNPQDKSYKSVLLISDGEDHDKESVAAAKELAKEGIMVNTIGIGSPSGAPIPDEITGKYKIDKNGNTIISKLNEQELKTISELTGGIYQLYTTPEKVINNLKKQLSEVEREAIAHDSSYLSLKQFYWYFLLTAFILLIIEMIISEKRRKGLKAAFFFVISLGLANISYAQQPNQNIRDGNQYFNQQKYDEAQKNYQKAIEKSPDNDIANFNLGNTFYRKNDPDNAVKAYDNTIQNTDANEVRQNAFYNKGVTYHKAEKLPEAIIAYKNALLLDPADEAARQNLQRALQKQKQQQQQSNTSNDPQKNKQKQNPQTKEQPAQQKPSPSSITKQEAEDRLKALANKEKELQDKLHKMKGVSRETPERDW